MRKADYQTLAEILSEERKAGYVQMRTGLNEERNIGRARMNRAEAIARTFAASASVDKAAFLEACGVES